MGAEGAIPIRPAVFDELSERTLTDIAREVEELRRENACLKGDLAISNTELDTLRPELLRSQAENTILRAAVKFLMREGGFLQPMTGRSAPHLASFPPEVLLRIFKATMPPLHEYDPAAMRPRNPWLAEIRFRKGLALVCKAWSWPATAVLYEDIVLRRMGQIPALARTLSSSGGRDFGVLIQHIRMDSCVVWASCSDVVRQDLLLILQRSVALRTFSFHAHPNFPIADSPEEGNSWDGFNPSWILQESSSDIRQAFQIRVSSGLRELDISMTLYEEHIVELHSLLSCAHTLTSLKVGPINVSPGVLEGHMNRRTLAELELPVLVEFQLYVDNHPFANLVRQLWRMPALTHLTAMNCRDVPLDLLRAHGRNLVYLHICPKKNHRVYDYSWDPCTIDHLNEDLSAACPALEHLVFPATRLERPASSILTLLRHRTLRYLDIWCHSCAATRQSVENECKEAVKWGRLPAIQRIRRLRRIVRPDLPLICHPSLVSGDEARLYRFAAGWVVQMSWTVVPDSGTQDDIPWFVHLIPPEDDSSTYVESDEEDEDDDENEGDKDDEQSAASDESPYDPFKEGSGSESSEEETDSDYDSDIDTEIPDEEQDVEALMEERLQEQFDRDTVLNMFQATQEYHQDGDDPEEGSDGVEEADERT